MVCGVRRPWGVGSGGRGVESGRRWRGTNRLSRTRLPRFFGRRNEVGHAESSSKKISPRIALDAIDGLRRGKRTTQAQVVSRAEFEIRSRIMDTAGSG